MSAGSVMVTRMGGNFGITSTSSPHREPCPLLIEIVSALNRERTSAQQPRENGRNRIPGPPRARCALTGQIARQKEKLLDRDARGLESQSSKGCSLARSLAKSLMGSQLEQEAGLLSCGCFASSSPWPRARGPGSLVRSTQAGKI